MNRTVAPLTALTLVLTLGAFKCSSPDGKHAAPGGVAPTPTAPIYTPEEGPPWPPAPPPTAPYPWIPCSVNLVGAMRGNLVCVYLGPNEYGWIPR